MYKVHSSFNTESDRISSDPTYFKVIDFAIEHAVAIIESAEYSSPWGYEVIVFKIPERGPSLKVLEYYGPGA
jgi:hypothetical protein